MALGGWRDWLSDPATPEAFLVAQASDSAAERGFLGALAGDAAWMGRCPALATALFGNPGVSMTVANRALSTCARAGAAPPDLPGFEELVAEIQADAATVDAVARDRGFAELLAAADTAAPEPDSVVEEPVAAPGGAVGGLGGPPTRRRAVIDFPRLKLYEKVRLATLGNANCRQVLLRDPNRMVALAAVRSPQITDGEIVKAAGNRALSEDVIRYIANRKELIKLYGVRLALVGNPKCGLAVALRLLPTLNAEDIKQLARSKNVPGALALAAKKLAATRGPQ